MYHLSQILLNDHIRLIWRSVKMYHNSYHVLINQKHLTQNSKYFLISSLLPTTLMLQEMTVSKAFSCEILLQNPVLTIRIDFHWHSFLSFSWVFQYLTNSSTRLIWIGTINKFNSLSESYGIITTTLSDNIIIFRLIFGSWKRFLVLQSFCRIIFKNVYNIFYLL